MKATEREVVQGVEGSEGRSCSLIQMIPVFFVRGVNPAEVARCERNP